MFQSENQNHWGEQLSRDAELENRSEIQSEMPFENQTSNCHKYFNQKLYMQKQVEEIQRYKWIESEKSGRDLGDRAIYEWIQRYACQYREWAKNCPEFFSEKQLSS